MKNRMPFAALTFAFTVAGSCIGATLHNFPEGLGLITLGIAFIGGVAASISGDIS
jgi:hypothetical protein